VALWNNIVHTKRHLKFPS